MRRRVRSCLLAPTLEPLEARVLLAISPAAAPPPVHVAANGEYIAQVRTPDLNGDGRPDLVMASGSRVVVNINRGDGTFRPGVSMALRDGLPRKRGQNELTGFVAGDFNGDGRMDLAVAGYTYGPRDHRYGRTWLVAGTASGGLEPVGLPGFTNFISEGDAYQVIDVEGDGTDELVNPVLQVFGFNGTRFVAEGTVADREWFNTYSDSPPTFADVDGDGETDVVTRLAAPPGGQAAMVLVRFTDAGPILQPLAAVPIDTRITLNDLTGDGLPELVFSRWQEIDGVTSLVVSALANNGGELVGDPQVIYQESRDHLRARGGHGPEPSYGAYYEVMVDVVELREVGGDSRPDPVLVLTSEEYTDYRGYTRIFLERYGVGLIAGDPATGEGLPTFTPVDIEPPDTEPAPRVVASQIASADFDGDGLQDLVLVRNFNRWPGYITYPWSAVYVDLAADERPLALAGAVEGDGRERGVERGGTLTVNARFRPVGPDGSPIAEVNVFLDTNQNRRLDAGDLRIGRSTTADAGNGNLYRFQLRRRPSWNAAGAGFVAVFTVAMDEAGRVSTPQSGRVRLW